MHYQCKGVSHNISLSVLTISRSGMHHFKSKPDSTLHLELSNTENVSLSSGHAKLFFAILTFRCLKSVTTPLPFVQFPTYSTLPGLE